MNYKDPEVAQNYTAFSDSENGLIQQEIIADAIQPHLPESGLVLDVACGNGWLAALLADRYEVRACDFSAELIKEAKLRYPDVNFEVGDATQTLPYDSNMFDLTIFNMAGHDVSDLPKAFSEITRVTKGGSKILVTIANPYYCFPVGVWKRGWRKFIPGQKPWLKLRSYFELKNKSSREFVWKENIQSFFYTLPEYIEAARLANLEVLGLQDLESKQDSSKFDFHFQLHNFPVILLLVFKKPLE